MKKKLLIAGTLTALSGCGGGSDPIDYAQEYANLVGEAQVLLADFEDARVTELTSMPSSGSFTYRGVAGFRSDTNDYDYILSNPKIVGDAEFNVNFETGSISGTIDNFVNNEGLAASGRVSISTGVVSGNSFSASITGALQSGDEAGAAVASMYGEFIDENARGMLGIIEGTVADDSIWGVVGAAR